MKPFHEIDPFGKKRLYNMLLLLHLSTRINPGVNEITFLLTPRLGVVGKKPKVMFLNRFNGFYIKRIYLTSTMG